MTILSFESEHVYMRAHLESQTVLVALRQPSGELCAARTVNAVHAMEMLDQMLIAKKAHG